MRRNMARKRENNRRDEMENSMVKVDVTCRVGHFGLIEVRSGGAMRSEIASFAAPQPCKS